jgi:hypothetical protein
MVVKSVVMIVREYSRWYSEKRKGCMMVSGADKYAMMREV